jgi:hypothetical protein
MHDEHIHPRYEAGSARGAGKPHAKGRLPARRLRLKEPDDSRDCSDFAGG